jgi:pimeloyl-ACP methyl ester carboxylesterase
LKPATILIAAAALAILAAPVHAAERIGVLVLHGKNPGSAQSPNLLTIAPRLEGEGMLVLLPDMPWSAKRYIDGDWDKAMGEIAAHVKALRGRGAGKIVVLAQSVGVPAALSHAARKGEAHALVLLAPGHVPSAFYGSRKSPIRASIDMAQSLVAGGQGDAVGTFNDTNQGQPLVVRMAAKAYLSYFDPGSDAEMSRTAPRVPASTPVLVVIGRRDSLFGQARSYLYDRLPPNPRSRYLEVNAGHNDTPAAALDAIVEWLRTAVAP